MSPDTVKKLKFSLIYKMFLNKQLNLEESIDVNNYVFCMWLNCNECNYSYECGTLRSPWYSKGIIPKEEFEELLELHPEMRIVL